MSARWLNKAATVHAAILARDSAELALERLTRAAEEPVVEEAADCLSDADAHLAAARDAINAAFVGIDS